MHVGLVIYGSLDRTSGGFQYDRRLVEYLRECGDTVDVCSLPWRTYPRHLADSYRPAVRERLNRPVDVLLQDELCHPSLWRHNPHLSEPEAIVSIVHLLRTNTAVPWWHRPIVERVERRYLDSVDGLVYNSAPTRADAEALATSAGPSTVAPPSTDRLPVDGSDTHIEQRSRERPLRVLYVGNVVRRKGLDTLLAGLPALQSDWTLTVVGDLAVEPEFTAAIRRQIDSQDLDEQVSLLGQVDDERLASELSRSHVLAMPSRHEPFGIVYLEAMAAGVVPLATAAGGATDIVQDGETGLVVPPETPAAITEALSGLATDRDRLRDLALGARRGYEQHPTWTESMERVRSFCKTLLDGETDAVSPRRGDAGEPRARR
jgi:glycosyltransferase involved in cell wall biosynthesis